MRLTGLVISSVFVLLLAGCSSDAPDLVQIDGRVTRGGQPVSGILLQFEPEEGRPSWGQSDAQGRFKLHYNKYYEGARIGKHKVFVAFPNSPETPYDATGQQKLSPTQREIVEKYGSRETTPLEVHLSEDGQVVEIKLD